MTFAISLYLESLRLLWAVTVLSHSQSGGLFMATIRKRGNRYNVQVRKQGQRPLSQTFLDKKTAETWAKKAESEIERGVFLDTLEAQSTALSQALDRYISIRTLNRRERSKIEHLRLYLGSHTLSNLTRAAMTRYRDTRLQLGLATSTVRRELELLRSILNTAIKDWGINLPHGNPVSQVRLPKVPRGRDRRLQGDEKATLLDALRYTPMVRSFVQFAVETAMRRGEIAAMHWEHVDVKSRTLRIPKTKTDTPRTIPLSRKAVEVLLSIPRRLDGLVWGLRADSITQAFGRACTRAGIEGLRLHDLRHEATSELFEKGLNLMEVASTTGHRDLRMLQRYTHIRPTSLLAKLDAPTASRDAG